MIGKRVFTGADRNNYNSGHSKAASGVGLPPENRHENELESVTGRRRANEGESRETLDFSAHSEFSVGTALVRAGLGLLWG